MSKMKRNSKKAAPIPSKKEPFEAEQGLMFERDLDGSWATHLKAVWHEDESWMKEVLRPDNESTLEDTK